MNTVTTPKPKLTPEERRERWWKRHPFPCYVQIKGKHGEAVFLIQSREDLYEVAMRAVKDRYEYKYYGEDDWYFSGSYEEYVEKEIGLSVAEVEKLVMGDEPVARELKELKTRFLGLKSQYFDEVEGLATLKLVRKILNHEVEPFAAVTLSLTRNGYQYEGFTIEAFSSIENGVP